MPINPMHDFDVYWVQSQNEDGDDEETFILQVEYRYNDWSIDMQHAGATLLDEILNPSAWFNGNAYRDMVGSDYAPAVVKAFLQQTVDRRDEIMATLGAWDATIREIEADAKRKRDEGIDDRT